MIRIVACAASALVAGAGVVALIAQSEQEAGVEAAMSAVLAVTVGWAYIGSGLLVWRHQSDHRIGTVLVFIGFAWFATHAAYSNDSFWFTIGTALEDVYLVGFVYLILVFPRGVLSGGLDRALTSAALFLGTVVEVAWLMFADSGELVCAGCPDNALQAVRNDALAGGLLQFQRASALALCVFTVGLFVRRVRRVRPPLRRAVAPVLWTGGAMGAALAVTIVNDVAGEPLGSAPNFMRGLVFAAVPVAVVGSMVQQRLARGAVARLVVDLGTSSTSVDLRAALSRALDDPDLQLAFWLPDRGTFVDSAGARFDPESSRPGQVTTLVQRDGRPVAALVHDEALLEDRDLVDSVCAAAAMALDNERLRAELVARLEELRASRERLVRAAELERHRIERDLHDGAQQRLVSIALSIALAEANLAKDPEVTASALDAARSGLTTAMGELRELSQGIRPAVLMERGLGAALEELSRRAVVPVRLELRLEAAVPAEIEAAAYFVAGEALANVAKHARATQVVIEAATEGPDLLLRIADDGIGGATARSGTGLRGLADRVEAFGGSLRIDSPAGQGTCLMVVLPCGS